MDFFICFLFEEFSSVIKTDNQEFDNSKDAFNPLDFHNLTFLVPKSQVILPKCMALSKIIVEGLKKMFGQTLIALRRGFRVRAVLPD